MVFATGLVSPAIAAPDEIKKIKPDQLTAAGTASNATNLSISGPIEGGSTKDISFPSTVEWKEHLELGPNKSWRRVTYTANGFQSQGISGYVGFPKEEGTPAFVGNAAFEGNAITELDLGSVTTVQFRSFTNNRITTINAPKLVTTGPFSFASNPISTLDAPVLEDVGKSAFQASRFNSLSLPAATKIGASAFFGSTVTELNAPKIESIGDKAFAGSNLRSLTLDALPELEGQPFINSAGASKYDGLFPLYIEGHKKNDVFPTHGVIVNPDDNWRDAVGFTPVEGAKYLTMHPKGELNTGFVTAVDSDGNEYFCVGEHIFFKSGYFVGTPMSGTVYVIQHGMNADPDTGAGAVENIVAIGEAPEDGKWIYGYEADLVSKLAFHAEELFTKYNITDRQGATKIVNLPTSDLNIQSQIVLTHENFADYARKNDNYDGLVATFGEEFMNELFARVTADKRTYTPATYYDYVGNATDVNVFGQPVVNPGQPVVDPGTPEPEEPTNPPVDPSEPTTPEPEDPTTPPVDPSEPTTPEPEDPTTPPVDPSEPTTPEPEDPTTPPEPTTPEPEEPATPPVSPEGDNGDELPATGTNMPVGLLLLVVALLVAAGASASVIAYRKRASSV